MAIKETLDNTHYTGNPNAYDPRYATPGDAVRQTPGWKAREGVPADQHPMKYWLGQAFDGLVPGTRQVSASGRGDNESRYDAIWIGYEQPATDGAGPTGVYHLTEHREIGTGKRDLCLSGGCRHFVVDTNKATMADGDGNVRDYTDPSIGVAGELAFGALKLAGAYTAEPGAVAAHGLAAAQDLLRTFRERGHVES